VSEGDTLSLGAVSIEVLSTPGHTGESSTYLIPDIGIFTGDTLFLAGIGRPDLHAGASEIETRARMLFASLKRLTSLDARLLVFPGHTSEPVSFDGTMLTASVGEVATRLCEWLSSEQDFVHRILERIPGTPPNYLEISRMNESGEWPDSDPVDLEAGANRCAVS
jgi:glyoxylase-like metal-dependent hydrolase (beta-lactamase superfamily II)